MTREIIPTEAIPAPAKRRRRRILAGMVAALVLGGTGVAYANHSFPDVPGNVYFHNAVAWAKSNGITTGYGNTGQFNPHANITRAEVVTLQHRYHKKFTPTQTLMAKVNSSGVLGQNVGATSADRPGTGNYRVVFDRNVTNCAYNITANTLGGLPFTAGVFSVVGDTVRLRIASHDGTLTNLGFSLTMTCANDT